MTAPRQVLPGTTYLVTRRCSQRQFLLRPGQTTNQVFGFVLAVAARRFGVRVHAFCVMSNHFHLVVTDPLAKLPAFQQYLASLVARALNASLGRWEDFWAPSSFSAVALATPDDVVAKAAYTLANPVAAGLVRRGRDWPGLRSTPDSVGASHDYPRPADFFRKRGPTPAKATLEFSAPPGFASAAEFRARLAAALGALEAKARTTVDGRTRTFAGAEVVLAQRPTARPSGPEPRRGLSPRVAAADKWKRMEALARLVDFVAAYRRAWRAFCAGLRQTVFPAGTYKLRVLQRVRCTAAS